MDFQWGPWLGLIATLGAALIGWFSGRNKTSAEAGKATAEADGTRIANEQAWDALQGARLSSALNDIVALKKQFAALEMQRDSLMGRVTALEQEILALKAERVTDHTRIAALEAENRRLRRRVQILERHMRDSGIEPPPVNGDTE